MKSFSLFAVFVVLGVIYNVNGKPMVSIGADIPIPSFSISSGVPAGSFPVEAGDSKLETSKEVETMDKSESVFFGYYPYYGWPNYGYHYPLVYVG